MPCIAVSSKTCHSHHSCGSENSLCPRVPATCPFDHCHFDLCDCLAICLCQGTPVDELGDGTETTDGENGTNGNGKPGGDGKNGPEDPCHPDRGQPEEECDPLNNRPDLLIAIPAGFEHIVTMIGTTVLIPIMLVRQMGGDHGAKARVIQTLLFVNGLSTLLQSAFGTEVSSYNPRNTRGSYCGFSPSNHSWIHLDMGKRFEVTVGNLNCSSDYSGQTWTL